MILITLIMAFVLFGATVIMPNNVLKAIEIMKGLM
jgi:hypothetical protein